MKTRCDRFQTICPLFPAIGLSKVTIDLQQSLLTALSKYAINNQLMGNDTSRTTWTKLESNVAKHITKTVDQFNR